MVPRFSVVAVEFKRNVRATHLPKPVLIQDFVYIDEVRFLSLSKTQVSVKLLLYGYENRVGRRPLAKTDLIEQLRHKLYLKREEIIENEHREPRPHIELGLDEETETTQKRTLHSRQIARVLHKIPRTASIQAPHVGGAPATSIIVSLKHTNTIHVDLSVSTLDYLYTYVHSQIASGDMDDNHHRAVRDSVGVKGLSRIYSVRERQTRMSNYRYEFVDDCGKRRRRYFCADDDEAARNIIVNEIIVAHGEDVQDDVEGSEMEEVEDE